MGLNYPVEPSITLRVLKRLLDFANKLVNKADGWGGDGLGRGLGLASALCGIWNDGPVGTCCMAQGPLPDML